MGENFPARFFLNILRANGKDRIEERKQVQMKTVRSRSFINGMAVKTKGGTVSNRSLAIELDSESARSLTLKIYDVGGRVLFEKHTGFLTENKAVLDITDYSLGMYFLQLENPQGKVQTERFVINN